MTTVSKTGELSKPFSCKFSFQRSWRRLTMRMQHILFRIRKAKHDHTIASGFGLVPTSLFPLKYPKSDQNHAEKEEVNLANFEKYGITVQVVEPPTGITMFLDMPFQVLQNVYEQISMSDVLSLRLTCTAIKKDVELCRGLVLKLHDGRLDYEKPLKQVGVEKLIVEQFMEAGLNYPELFPFRNLLRTLEIVGSISDENLEFLLEASFNLENLIITLQSPQQLFESNVLATTNILHNLKSLEISLSDETLQSVNVLICVRDILRKIQCPNLGTFVYHAAGFMVPRIDQYQIYILEFLRNHSSLKRITVHLTTGVHSPHPIENTQLGNDWMHNGPTSLEKLKLIVNELAYLWYPFVDSQLHLRRLNLELTNQSWNRLILVLDRNARTLNSLTVTGLCSTARDGLSEVPIDLRLLKNLKQLKTLEIQHLDMESRGLNPPSVLNTADLPHSLKSVKLCRLHLQPHQALLILLKLPHIDKVELECWADSESTLGGFFAVLGFLIKFDQTGVTRLRVTDKRRRMENLEYEITKMRRVLGDKIAMFQSNTELHSSLELTRLN